MTLYQVCENCRSYSPSSSAPARCAASPSPPTGSPPPSPQLNKVLLGACLIGPFLVSAVACDDVVVRGAWGAGQGGLAGSGRAWGLSAGVRRLAWPRAGPAGCSGDQDPGAVAAGQALADQVAQVDRGGAAFELGVVAGRPAVAELEAASPPGGDLGDAAFDVGPVPGVVLAQPGVGGPGGAGGAQQPVVGCRTRIRPFLEVVQRWRSGQPRQAAPKVTLRRGRDGPGQPGWAGGGPGLLIDGEVIEGNPPGTAGCSGLGLITAWSPAVPIASRRSPVP